PPRLVDLTDPLLAPLQANLSVLARRVRTKRRIGIVEETVKGPGARSEATETIAQSRGAPLRLCPENWSHFHLADAQHDCWPDDLLGWLRTPYGRVSPALPISVASNATGLAYSTAEIPHTGPALPVDPAS